MERYTHKAGDGEYVISGELLFEDQNEDYFGSAADRLAAYEDTGLEPEEIDSLPTLWMEKVKELLEIGPHRPPPRTQTGGR